MLPGGEEGVDAQLFGAQTDLAQTLGLEHSRVPAREVLERFTGEELQRLVQDVRRPVRLAQREELAGALHEVLERMAVDVLGKSARR